jgi:hypothetical protein
MSPSQTGFETLIAAFEDLEIKYLIGGSVASSVFGRPRATNDIDILAALHANRVPELARRLANEFVAFEDEILSALRAGRSFNLIHRRTTSKFDVFPAMTAFEREQLKRAARVAITFLGDTLHVPVASPEDILLAKLKWFRDGGETSDRQWSDIRGVADMQAGKLDVGYLNKWAHELGVEHLLAPALASS